MISSTAATIQGLICLYFGAVFMDEIVSIQYQELEQVRPNFGYADFTFRSVSRGSRLVSGSFTINFKESMYLPKLLETLRNPGTMEANLQRLDGFDPYTQEAKDKLASTSVVKMAIAGDYSLEDFISMAKSGSNTYRPTDFNLDSHYAETMDALDSAIWGEGEHFNERDVIKRTASETTRGIELDRAKFRGPTDGFDIIIKYGQPADRYPGQPGWGTIEKIRGCHITGASKAIDDSGRNIMEVYNFLAKTVE